MTSDLRCLVTGFEPFDGDTVNPSWQIAQALHGQALHGASVHAVRLPCSFDGALPVLRAALRRHRPQLVLALGQAARSVISLERVALNVIDARIPDNAGAQPIDEPAQPGAPAAYFGTLPIKAMLAALREAGIGAEVSQTAGTFVCNHVFFGLMHALRRRPGVRGGFVHVPLLPAQAAARGLGPGMPLGLQTAGVRLALATAICTAGQDLRLGAGQVD
ncbi:MAG: pyroglutamyl-peptidase I [Rubrivivax sp.]|nr:pyroglutamyl-peptidase I [Rubrivivax sp.]